MGKAIFLDSLDFSSNNLGKVTRVKTRFAIEQTFVGDAGDIIDTRLNLFGDDMPEWSMLVRGVLDTATIYPATAIDCMLGVDPWPGITISNASAGDYGRKITMSMNFPEHNPVKTWKNEFACYIKREGNVVSYSYDGITWIIGTSQLDSVLSSNPSLKMRSLLVGGGLSTGENIGRPFVGQLYVKLTTPME
jgi:hypothetical protein